MEATKACHNCRKRRLRCDRSVPGCNKCLTSGQACQGYGKAYQWTNAVASRGRMAGKKTFAPNDTAGDEGKSASGVLVRVRRKQPGDGTEVMGSTMHTILIDPLFQHMGNTSRFYLDYFSKRICQELVTHDSFQLTGNPFRQLIAMSTSYPFLQHILVAASAMHYSNVARKLYHEPGRSKASVDALVDGLRARHSAIKGLQVVLEGHKTTGIDSRDPDERDALLATVLFFINFALIDSGKGGWRSHMKAARELIAAQASNFALTPRKLEADCDVEQSVMAISNIYIKEEPLVPQLQFTLSAATSPIGIRDYIASDSVAYYIWGTTLDSLSNSAAGKSASIVDTEDIRSIIVRTEANSYHSCPAQLLVLILCISRLARDVGAGVDSTANPQQMDLFVEFLVEAQSFDPVSWANRICTANAHVREVDDVEIRLRTYIAAAYRSAVCLYVLLAAPGLEEHVAQRQPTCSAPLSLLSTENLTTMILQQLSLIPSSHPLFKYTTWPVFMTGVEAATPESRTWVLQRLSAMWELCPWGMMKSAKDTLMEIWQLRDSHIASNMAIDASDEVTANITDRNWLIQLRLLGSDFLII